MPLILRVTVVPIIESSLVTSEIRLDIISVGFPSTLILSVDPDPIFNVCGYEFVVLPKASITAGRSVFVQ